jgi:hypothetical protein
MVDPIVAGSNARSSERSRFWKKDGKQGVAGEDRSNCKGKGKDIPALKRK